MKTDDVVKNTTISSFRIGDSIKAKVVDKTASRILVELPEGQVGIITKKEASGDGVTTEDIEVGAEVQATIIEPENDQGLIVLSFRRASQDTAWAELGAMVEDERNLKIKIYEANKGGLMAKYKGIKAFLPVSQLMPVNYPRVDGAESGEILTKLQSFAGKDFIVRVITADREAGKVILSEKLANEGQIKETLANLSVGDRVQGVVSGIVKFGIFVTFGGVEGLVHLSEIDWGHVSNPSKNYSIGDKLEVLVIGIDGEKLSFSIKQLGEDPWLDKVSKYDNGEEVSGKVARWNDTGVFIEVTSDIQGLFSIDQFGVKEGSKLGELVNNSTTLTGSVVSVNTDSHRLELKLSDADMKKMNASTDKEDKADSA
ncbi:MAG TPA: S1 RNA-binding domain-containing protein [Candidatus Gracilibacteria bacterium]